MSTLSKRRVVVVATDFSPFSDAAMDRGFELAFEDPNVELHVIHVARFDGVLVGLEIGAERLTVDMNQASENLQTYVKARLASFTGDSTSNRSFTRAVTHVRIDAPADGIVQLASDLGAQLVVVGTHGRQGVTRALLGSVAEQVVRSAPCSVLVVRPQKVTSPEIEAPCPQCAEARLASEGQQLWCAEHRQHHGRRHTYHIVSRLSKQRERLPGLGSDD